MRLLLKAAHTYSHNWSRITSISRGQQSRTLPIHRTCPKPCPAVATTPPGSFSRQRLAGNAASPDPHLRSDKKKYKPFPAYNSSMNNAKETLDQSFLEMRWRCLSLAADLDRVQRAEGGPALLRTDARLAQLRQAVAILLRDETGRAEAVQNVFSDK